MSNILSPFLNCETPEEAKDLLDKMRRGQLGNKVHKLLFTKVISS
jgi:hypothetical protein